MLKLACRPVTTRLIDDEILDEARVRDSRDFARKDQLWVCPHRGAKRQRVRYPEVTRAKLVGAVGDGDIERCAAAVHDAQAGWTTIEL